MSDKFREHTTITTDEADELRVIVSELNESVAKLSKVILQLQESVKDNLKSRLQNGQPKADEKKPKTFH